MDLNEAKQLLSKNGFLLERINTRRLYLCFYLYGDRAHSRPEAMEIKCATLKKSEVIDTLASFFAKHYNISYQFHIFSTS